MIAFIEGDIATLTPTQVVLNVGGLGYEVNITLLDYSQLHELKHAKLYVTEIIREDAYTLYGFLEESARLFLINFGRYLESDLLLHVLSSPHLRLQSLPQL